MGFFLDKAVAVLQRRFYSTEEKTTYLLHNFIHLQNQQFINYFISPFLKFLSEMFYKTLNQFYLCLWHISAEFQGSVCVQTERPKKWV